MGKPAVRAKIANSFLEKLPAGFLCLLIMQNGCRVSEMVKPGLFSSVVLYTIQVFLPVMHVVLKGAVTVVTEVSLPHCAGYVLKPARRHLLKCTDENVL